MRTVLLFLAVLFAAATACGAGAAVETPIVFGLTGGNIFHVNNSISMNNWFFMQSRCDGQTWTDN